MDKVKRLVLLCQRYLDGKPVIVVIGGKRRRVNRLIAFVGWITWKIIQLLLAD